MPEYYEGPPPLESPEDHEDILHPLREAANRVGREVEKFAEILDRYNPQRATASDKKHEMVVELIEIYYDAAAETVKRLRDEHASERRKKDGLRWKKKMQGFNMTHDDDDTTTWIWKIPKKMNRLSQSDELPWKIWNVGKKKLRPGIY